MSDNRAAVADAMKALGSAYRGDWSDFDGRSLRSQLDDLASWLDDDAEPVTFGELCLVNRVCPESRCWAERCGFLREPGVSWCVHLHAVAEKMRSDRREAACHRGQSELARPDSLDAVSSPATRTRTGDAVLSLVVTVAVTLFAMACGYYIAWLQYADRAGTYYIPETTDEQCGWIHDGILFTSASRTSVPAPTHKETP